MLSRNRVLQILGIGIGLAVAGVLGSMSWSTLVGVFGLSIVLTVFVPPRYSDKNPHVLSVGFWIAIGMLLIVPTWSFFNFPYFAWIITAWLVFSVLAGIAWPLSAARKLANNG